MQVPEQALGREQRRVLGQVLVFISRCCQSILIWTLLWPSWLSLWTVRHKPEAPLGLSSDGAPGLWLEFEFELDRVGRIELQLGATSTSLKLRHALYYTIVSHVTTSVSSRRPRARPPTRLAARTARTTWGGSERQ